MGHYPLHERLQACLAKQLAIQEFYDWLTVERAEPLVLTFRKAGVDAAAVEMTPAMFESLLLNFFNIDEGDYQREKQQREFEIAGGMRQQATHLRPPVEGQT